MALRDRVRQAARVVAVGWPALLALVLVVVGWVTGANARLEAIIFLGVVQVIWLALWSGIPKLAHSAGRRVGEHRD